MWCMSTWLDLFVCVRVCVIHLTIIKKYLYLHRQEWSERIAWVHRWRHKSVNLSSRVSSLSEGQRAHSSDNKHCAFLLQMSWKFAATFVKLPELKMEQRNIETLQWLAQLVKRFFIHRRMSTIRCWSTQSNRNRFVRGQFHPHAKQLKHSLSTKKLQSNRFRS
jgi:hypothetical protein